MPINQINQLRYAVSVAELGSFSAAARVCGVSQPTVSGAVVDLEDQLGIRLFVRSTRRVDATPAGHRVISLMRAVLHAVDDVHRAIDGLVKPAVPELRLGFTPLVGAARLGVLIEPFRRMQPDVRVIFQETGWNDLEDRLDRGVFDVIFGVGFRRHRSRSRAVLFSDRLWYLRRSGSPASSGSIVIADVTKDVLLLTQDLCGLASATRALLDEAKLRFTEYAGKAMSYSALEEWTELGIGGAVVPEAHIRAMNRAQMLVNDSGKPITIPSEAVWRKDLLVSAHGKSFASYLQRIVPAVAKGIANAKVGT